MSIRLGTLSKETKVALLLSSLLHVLLLISFFLIKITGAQKGSNEVELRFEIPRTKVLPVPPQRPPQNLIQGHIIQQVPSVQAPSVESFSDIPFKEMETTDSVASSDSVQPYLPFPTQITFAALDSLARIYPELKHALLKEAVIRSGLKDDSVHLSINRPLLELMERIKFPSEMEGMMLQNRRMFGTTYNPMRAAPAPNQVDIVQLVAAIANLYHAFGGK